MKDLVDDDAVRGAVAQRKRVHVALAEARTDTGKLKLHPREAKHLGRTVDPDGFVSARAEQFDHPAGACADIHKRSETAAIEGAFDCPFDLGFRDVKRARIHGRVDRNGGEAGFPA